MKVLLVSPDPRSREFMSLALRSLERRIGQPMEFLEATDGEQGIKAARREQPEVIVADEIASRAGAFALVKELRGDTRPFGGVIAILLERKHDTWLAKWSGADLWFVRPVDPFELADRVLEMLTAKEPA